MDDDDETDDDGLCHASEPMALVMLALIAACAAAIEPTDQSTNQNPFTLESERQREPAGIDAE